MLGRTGAIPLTLRPRVTGTRVPPLARVPVPQGRMFRIESLGVLNIPWHASIIGSILNH